MSRTLAVRLLHSAAAGWGWSSLAPERSALVASTKARSLGSMSPGLMRPGSTGRRIIAAASGWRHRWQRRRLGQLPSTLPSRSLLVTHTASAEHRSFLASQNTQP